jgi:hypothetical protein
MGHAVTSEFERVLDAIQRACSRFHEFTTDEVWSLLDFVPTQRNIVGKAFAEAHRLGWIKGTGRYVKSTRPEARGRAVQVWRPA